MASAYVKREPGLTVSLECPATVLLPDGRHIEVVEWRPEAMVDEPVMVTLRGFLCPPNPDGT